jgi:hypothetical protein
MPEDEYLRIGTTFYRRLCQPLASGQSVEVLKPWQVECIKQDHGKDFLSTIPKYAGFCMVPSHMDYKQEINGFYNCYHPFPHQLIAGQPTKILVFLNHIFGEQLKLGIDYLKILLLNPLQILPILCLVSTERNTGKTTFLNFLKALFGENMTINSNEDFRSNFNAEWASKLIIGVDETFLDRKEDSERIKSLSTSQFYKIEAKGQDRQEILFFGKFVLCSNNEDSFIQIDAGEIRYWIRKLPTLKQDNNQLLEELKKEIPFFIHYLVNTPYSTISKTRMWFTPEQIKTSALESVKRYNRNKLEVEMGLILLSILDTIDNVKEVCFCIPDMQSWLLQKGFRGYDAGSVKRVIQEVWKLKPSGNSNAYIQYRMTGDGKLYEFKHKGRFYTASVEMILAINNLDDFDDNNINSS